jgi:steroid delta-isomerase-like uncharacterized protein
MSTVENKAVIRRLMEEMVNKGNFAVAEDLVAEDWQSVDPPPGQEPGRKGLIATVARMRAAFPDLEFTIEDMVAEGDKVAGSIIMRGTHQGEFMGIPPTGKRVTVRGMGIDYCAAGQCKQSQILFDNLSLLQQLGVIQAPGQ